MDIRLKSQYQLRHVDPEPANFENDNGVNYTITPENTKQSVSDVASIRWIQLRKLGATLYPTSSSFGKPTKFLCGSKFLVIGTFSADVLLFDYEQTLITHLSPHKTAHTSGDMLGPVTSLALSSDESHIAVGFGLGFVSLIDLESPPYSTPKLISLVKPLPPTAVEWQKSQVHETHIHGIPVVKCGFVGTHRRLFVTVDATGVVISHKRHRILMEYRTRSRRILGNYKNPAPIISAAFHGYMVALMTSDLLEVVKIDPEASGSAQFQEALRIPRAKDTQERPNGRGVTKFYQKTGDTEHLYLIFTWGKELKLLQFDLTITPIPAVSVISGYTHSGAIEQLDWVTHDSIVIFAKVSGAFKVDLVKLSDAISIDSEVLSKTRRPMELLVSGYSIFLLGKHEFLVGSFSNWADRLLAYVNNGQPTLMVKLALHYYEIDGDLSIFGLPANESARRMAVKKAMPDLILTAMQFSQQYDHESLKTLLPESLNAVAITKANILEELMEIVDNEQWSREAFLNCLMDLIRTRKISYLPPPVFQEMVNNFTDPHMFYNLDLSTLNLDLAFRLCEKFPEKLSEAKIYLENMALHDYTSPLRDEEHAFGYLAIILTSRVYPTGDELPEELARIAKLQIFDSLFLQDEEFTALNRLLTCDKPQFYRALNEAFEDSWLNDNPVVNRQTIMNTLLNLSSPERSNGLFDPNFCIFLARNYPKYRQYLVLPETALQKTIDTLCDSEKVADPEEAQLALLSLLSNYKPRDLGQFMHKMSSLRYDLVLEYLFRKGNKLVEIAELKVRKFEADGSAEDLWLILHECVLKARTRAVIFIQKKFVKLLSAGVHELVSLVIQHDLSELWSLSTSDAISIAHQKLYLDALFDEITRRGGRLPSMQCRVHYIDLLASNGTEDKQGTGPRSDSRLMYVLTKIMIGPNDIELPMVVDTLMENERYDALALLLSRKGRKSEAMIYLLNYLPDLAAQANEGPGEKSSDQTKLQSISSLAATISLEVAQENREEGNQLCQRLVEVLIDSALDTQLSEVVTAMAASSAVDMPKLLAQLLQGTAKPALAPKSRSPESLPTKIIQKVYADLRIRERGLRCLFEIVSNDGYHELLKTLSGRSRGWAVPIESECEVCGHKISGLGIDAAKLYAEWWDRLKNRPSGLDFDADALILFQCGHSYHNGCLQRMAKRRVCVVCSPS